MIFKKKKQKYCNVLAQSQHCSKKETKDGGDKEGGSKGTRRGREHRAPWQSQGVRRGPRRRDALGFYSQRSKEIDEPRSGPTSTLRGARRFRVAHTLSGPLASNGRVTAHGLRHGGAAGLLTSGERQGEPREDARGQGPAGETDVRAN